MGKDYRKNCFALNLNILNYKQIFKAFRNVWDRTDMLFYIIHKT